MNDRALDVSHPALGRVAAASPQLDHLDRLFLWLNSGCNSRCRMCDIWKEPKGVQLSPAQVARLAPEWQRLSVARVVICGEPLLHPQLWRIVEIVREHGIAVEMLSNGYLVARHAARIVANCEVLRISLDGPEGVHDDVRGINRAYMLVGRAIAAVHDVSAEFPVDGRCAVHRVNFRHLRATVRAARSLGFRSISFSGTDVFNEEAFRRHGRLDAAYVESLAIAPDELGELRDQLDLLVHDCAEDFASGFITDTPESLNRILLQYYRALAGQRSFPAPRCNAPWTSAILEYDGTVRPCFPLAAYGRMSAEAGFIDVLNSRRALSLRDTLDMRSNASCQHCVCQTVIT
jgi:Fe-coproporphyrin III synthase